MGLFRKIRDTKDYFEEDSLDKKFNEVMKWLKELSRKDYNKFKKAMDKDYEAYQILHGIEPTEDMEIEETDYMLTKEDK